MIKKLMLLSSSLLSLNVLGAESHPEDIVSLTEESQKFLKMCKPGIVEQIAYQEYPELATLGVNHWVLLKQLEALKEIETIKDFAKKTHNGPLKMEASKRKRAFENVVDNTIPHNSPDQAKRIKTTHNAKNV